MKQRVLTAVVLIPPVLAALFSSASWPIVALAILVYAIGLTELARLLQTRIPIAGGVMWLLLAIVVAITEPKLTSVQQAGAAAVACAVGVTNAWIAAEQRDRRMAFGSPLWLLAPLVALVLLHQIGKTENAWQFASPALLAIVPLWGGDTAAIFAGKAWGRHPMAPTISPKKTWEGGIANLLACVAVAIPLAIWIGYSWPVGICCGLAAGTLGQFGDLFESYVKRRADLKDSGTLLPGHGGIMDRIDSILFTAPAVALILALVSR